jgi:hypothetical protein
MTAELAQTLAEAGISTAGGMRSADEALVYRLLDSVSADGGLTDDAKREVRTQFLCLLCLESVTQLAWI